MDLKENITISVSSLLSNKMRTALTMLGIVIGVASVISMVSIGRGAQKQTEDRIKGLGTNLVMISPGRMRFHGPGGGSSGSQSLTKDDYELIRDKAEHLRIVAPELGGSGVVKYKNKTLSSSISGTTPEWLSARNQEIESGRFITSSDNEGLKNVCVLGANVRENLFSDLDPVGMDIKIKNLTYKVVGVMKKKGESAMGGLDDSIVIPFNTARLRMFQTNRLRMIIAEVISDDKTAEAIESMTELLRKKHKTAPGADNDFTIRSQKEFQDVMQNVTGIFTLLLGSIAAVSLLVGGIGIMNIMLVTVTERTREIGIRKAIGARRKEILLQFLIESVVLSIMGGIIGIILGTAGSKLISQLAGWTTVITTNSVVYAFLFSVSVGLFFGIYPAKKAAGLNPIEALRYE